MPHSSDISAVTEDKAFFILGDKGMEKVSRQEYEKHRNKHLVEREKLLQQKPSLVFTGNSPEAA